MGNARDALGIDIGADSLKLVYGRRVGNELRVSVAESVPISDEAGIQDDGQIVRNAISEALRRHGLKPSAIVCAVERSAATVRVLSLPPTTSGDELARIVRYEAESHLPFPVDAAEMAHKSLMGPSGEPQALVAACLKTTVGSLRQALAEAGAPATEVAVSSLATTNCLLASDPALASGTHIVVDIGAEVTEAAVIHQRVPIHTFTIGLGARMLTLAIAQDGGVPLAEAEATKRTKGLALGGDGMPTDPESDHVGAWLSRLYTGIRRAVESRAQAAPESPVASIVLLGGGALTPGLAGGLQDALGVPVRYGDPAGGLGFSPAEGVQPVVLATAAGLALQGVGLATHALDLTPRAVFAERRARTRKALTMAGAAVFVGVLLVATGWTWSQERAAQREYRSVRGELQRQLSQAGGMDLTEQEVEALQWIVDQASQETNDPLAVLECFAQLLPQDMRIRDMSFRREDSVSIKGEARSNAAIADAIHALEKQEWFEDVVLTSTTATEVGGETLYTFDIECDLPGGEA